MRIVASKSLPRLGTTQAVFLAALLVLGFTPAKAQEDVAETKSVLNIDATPITEPPITDTERSHWSFTPIQSHLPPATNRAEWSRTAIDAFILAKLESKEIEPSSEASRPTLLRRLTFDLTGLPSTPAEIAEFEANRTPDAFERQIDRLLASPAFGERYAQYWLDLARFAETDGFEHDYVRNQAWRYRDWVIAALNADIPYDEFIRQQLASDEIVDQQSAIRNPQSTIDNNPKSKIQNPKSPPPPFPPSSIPSMFCLSGPDMPDVNDQAERRHILLNEMTATVGAAFLGLQLGCAQCHNHKYDPISQADFYRLRAVFEPAVATLKRDQPCNILINQSEPTPARFWIRGDHRRPGLELTASFPRIADFSSESAIRNPQSATSSPQRTRTELAQWLMSPNNPLTARVIANRLWQYHFGRGICTTPSDFGVMGGEVTHPDLLDYLATNLRVHNWSMKHLHRLILSSATYRQASRASNPQSAIRNPQSNDPDNLHYSRFPRQRLSGESIRDAMLAAAGLLTSERGGPGVMPPLPEELLSTLLKNQWSTSKREADHYKRSIYVFARRNLRYPIFEAFDRPDGNATCPIRNRSTTAPQSLLLFNSELSLLAAQHLAGRIINEKSVPREQIDRLYLLTLSRRPTKEEAATLEKFLATQRARLATESRPREELAAPANLRASADPYAAAALTDACLALLNTNEFIYID